MKVAETNGADDTEIAPPKKKRKRCKKPAAQDDDNALLDYYIKYNKQMVTKHNYGIMSATSVNVCIRAGTQLPVKIEKRYANSDECDVVAIKIF